MFHYGYLLDVKARKPFEYFVAPLVYTELVTEDK